jgi:hypothetical protein
MLDKMTKGALVLMAVAAIAAPALAAQPTRSAAMPDVGVAPNTPWAEAPLAILYNQYDNSGAVALNSQNFEAAYDAYDDQAADDFFVPANTSWKIVGVGIQGLYFNGPGPADSFNIFLYTDTANEPGVLRITRSNMAYTLNGTDQFRIKVNPAINVPASPSPRHLWISVQANLDFAGGLGGQFGWTDRTIANNSGAAWQNPGGGFGVCPSWDILDNCFGGLNDGDDMVYLLVGTSTPLR